MQSQSLYLKQNERTAERSFVFDLTQHGVEACSFSVFSVWEDEPGFLEPCAANFFVSQKVNSSG